MIRIPEEVLARFGGVLSESSIDASLHPEYVKWLRYYLDFCAKYVVTEDQGERVRLFLQKLRDKKQGEVHCRRAAC